MAAPSWALPWLLFAGTAIVAQLLICDMDAPSTEGSVFSSMLGLVTGTYCEDLPGLVSFILFLTITLPGVLLLYELITPVFSTTVGGAIAGAAALLLLGGFFVGVL